MGETSSREFGRGRGSAPCGGLCGVYVSTRMYNDVVEPGEGGEREGAVLEKLADKRAKKGMQLV